MAAIHPSAGHSFLGATYGWHGSWTLSPSDIYRRDDDRHCRFRHGPGCVRHLAAHPYADTDRGPDRRLRPAGAELQYLEAPAGYELAQSGAVHHWRRGRRADRHDAAVLYQPGASAN